MRAYLHYTAHSFPNVHEIQSNSISFFIFIPHYVSPVISSFDVFSFHCGALAIICVRSCLHKRRKIDDDLVPKRGSFWSVSVCVCVSGECCEATESPATHSKLDLLIDEENENK